MPPTERARVQKYFAALSPDARRELKKVRSAIRAVAPKAVEGFSYQMPCFRFDGRILVWYAAFRSHTSMFPMTGGIRRSLAGQLDGYETAKGTVRFPRTRPIPATLVKRLVKARIAELRAGRR